MPPEDPNGYAALQHETSPPWMQRPNGAAWNFAVGTMKDGYLEAAKRAVLARFPDGAPQDALARIARTFNLDTGIADLLGIEALRTVLAAAWDAWAFAGTKAGLLARLAELGLNASIYEAWEWAPGTPAWWRFWVVIRPVGYSADWPSYPWDNHLMDDGTWDGAGTSWDDPGVWAEAPPPDWLARIRATIAKWKPTHAVCDSIVLLQSGETFGTRIRDYPYLKWGAMQWLPAQISYLPP